jgi:hypothetical protein
MRRSVGVEPLCVVRAAAIEVADGPPWLVEGIWTDQAVGILGGMPKSGKTWLALEIAIAVSSGKPALDRFPVPRAGPVLVFAAEDSPPMVRSRLESLALHKGLRLDDVPVHLIIASRLRLDTTPDQDRLAETVRLYRPRLLVLDPFVRIYGAIDENVAGEVAGILGYLRQLSREHGISVLVVHHARKAGSSSEQAGLSLRGSGDFYAWTDETLSLRKRQDQILLCIEHRYAPSPEPIPIQLRAEDDEPPHLAILGHVEDRGSTDLHDQIIRFLERQPEPATQEGMREILRVRMQRLVLAIRRLESQGRIHRSAAGWSLHPNGAPPKRPP